MKRDKIIFYIATVLLTALMLFSVGNYFFKHDMISKAFESFGYPTYLIYPYAVLKIVGIIVLWLPGLKTLKEWAYSAFFFAFVFAFFAHYMIGDGEQMFAIVAITLLLVSYIFHRRIKG